MVTPNDVARLKTDSRPAGPKMMSKEDAEHKILHEAMKAKRKARSALAREAGVETPEELVAFAIKGRTESDDDLDRRLFAGQQKSERLWFGLLRRALNDRGVRAEDMRDVIEILQANLQANLRRAAEVDEVDDVDLIAEAADRLKGRRPEMFAPLGDSDPKEVT